MRGILIAAFSMASFFASQAFAQADGGWLDASAPAQNKAVQVVTSPRELIIEICSNPGNAGALLVSTESNPNASGIPRVTVRSGECVVVTGEKLFVSLQTSNSDNRGYFRFRIRE